MNGKPSKADYLTLKEYEKAYAAWQKRTASHERAIYMRSDKPISQHEPGAKMDQDKIDLSLLE